ncbi:MAG TPA: hypothetical protein VF315_06515 [Steroidobacteraceae bacterium]|jgi:hypothetical protein
MKLSSPNVEKAHQERKERRRREHAAAQTVRSAYPQVAQVQIALQFEDGTTNAPASQSYVLHPPARAFFGFPCPYADCDGQFDLHTAVTSALGSASHQSHGQLQCQGTRARDRATGRLCQLHLDYRVAAQYKRDDAA